MSSYNNRLNQVIALHRKSERTKRGAILIRGKEARAVRRVVKTRIAGCSRNLPDTRSRQQYAEVCKARNAQRKK